jgi:hypothetical protein
MAVSMAEAEVVVPVAGEEVNIKVEEEAAVAATAEAHKVVLPEPAVKEVAWAVHQAEAEVARPAVREAALLAPEDPLADLLLVDQAALAAKQDREVVLLPVGLAAPAAQEDLLADLQLAGPVAIAAAEAAVAAVAPHLQAVTAVAVQAQV